MKGSIREAYRLGRESATEAHAFGDFAEIDLENHAAMESAILDICENKRQYASHPAYDFNQMDNDQDMWDAFERGEIAAARRASLKAARIRRGLLKRIPVHNRIPR